ncbi:thioesterase family protein [Parvibaculum sp.]|uniref:acyl-CoA thioesterase n=1 Tax=Parvibaculum sp. TaxID=2024848 RepID=UPI001B1BA6DA|nr:thioesterase family protein [Parvibaculum sp.]MBO6668187.1 acyl-CoA thioesterase [Parvibaculum sp.]MBO6691721.1 acyl-CoA thioesterase [Parvibaculum sp.]MBO6714695.1 acyl-CoA thioesterase [Parvibaculum sp.]
MARSEFRFSWPLRVRYSEIDAQNVVFNAHYLTYCDVAITEYLRAAGLVSLQTTPEGVFDFHVVKSTVEYRAPIRFDEDIEVFCRTAPPGRSSLAFLLEIHGAGREDLRSAGEIIWVNADQATHRSAPIPHGFRKALSVFEAGEPAV